VHFGDTYLRQEKVPPSDRAMGKQRSAVLNSSFPSRKGRSGGRENLVEPPRSPSKADRRRLAQGKEPFVNEQRTYVRLHHRKGRPCGGELRSIPSPHESPSASPESRRVAEGLVGLSNSVSTGPPPKDSSLRGAPAVEVTAGPHQSSDDEGINDEASDSNDADKNSDGNSDGKGMLPAPKSRPRKVNKPMPLATTDPMILIITDPSLSAAEKKDYVSLLMAQRKAELDQKRADQQHELALLAARTQQKKDEAEIEKRKKLQFTKTELQARLKLEVEKRKTAKESHISKEEAKANAKRALKDADVASHRAQLDALHRANGNAVTPGGQWQPNLPAPPCQAPNNQMQQMMAQMMAQQWMMIMGQQMAGTTTNTPQSAVGLRQSSQRSVSAASTDVDVSIDDGYDDYDDHDDDDEDANENLQEDDEDEFTALTDDY
jgi:hypothetical protein